jgi:hypothetical protein
VRFKQVTLDTIYSIGLSVLDNNAYLKMTSGNGQLYPAYMADFTVNYVYYGNETSLFNFNKIILPNYIQDNAQYNITVSKTNPTSYQINY